MIVAMASACSAPEEVGGLGPRDGDAPPALDGRTFLSKTVTGRKLVAGTRIQLSFTDGNVGATAGCNSLGAPYSLAGDTLVIQGAGMTQTEIGCDPDRHAQDEWLSEFLTSEPTMTLSGSELTLTRGTTTIGFVDREVADPDRPLVGTSWRVDTIIDREAASSVPDETDVILRFPTDSSFEVSSEGCTSASGEMQVGPGTITFGELAVDDVGCPSPWAETLRVLRAGETTYEIEAARLTIEAGDVGIAAVAVEEG
jgi:heat shock protein HslJ